MPLTLCAAPHHIQLVDAVGGSEHTLFLRRKATIRSTLLLQSHITYLAAIFTGRAGKGTRTPTQTLCKVHERVPAMVTHIFHKMTCPDGLAGRTAERAGAGLEAAVESGPVPSQCCGSGEVHGDIVIALHIAREDEVIDRAIAETAQARCLELVVDTEVKIFMRTMGLAG